MTVLSILHQLAGPLLLPVQDPVVVGTDGLLDVRGGCCLSDAGYELRLVDGIIGLALAVKGGSSDFGDRQVSC
jgi:hypothetical protein